MLFKEVSALWTLHKKAESLQIRVCSPLKFLSECQSWSAPCSLLTRTLCNRFPYINFPVHSAQWMLRTSPSRGWSPQQHQFADIWPPSPSLISPAHLISDKGYTPTGEPQCSGADLWQAKTHWGHVVMPCSLVYRYRRFGGPCYRHVPDRSL